MQRFAGKIIFALVCCITLVIAGQAAASMPQLERQKYAILIGIDEYSGSGFGQLQGAKNDIALIEKVLMGRLQFKRANISKLLDHDATHTNIAAAFTQLAERVDSGDSVYIHYSGHGSETPDLNGDEKDNRKLDSTWVSYGSRVSADAVPSPKADGSRSGAPLTAAEVSASIDNFDILDDELNGWLAKISAKTDQLVFVSDSCHSGTITRGGNDPSQLGTRGIIEDTRHHPLGALPAVSGNLAGIRISACRDKEEAGEYRGPDGKPHGIFSLFWAQALEQAQPQDTWEMLAKRTGALVEANATRGQHPVFEPRNCSLAVFGGHFPERKPQIPVSSSDGRIALIAAGSLLGVTVGSTYEVQGPRQAGAAPAVLKIIDVQPTRSKGECTGEIKIGDLVVLKKYLPETSAIKIAIRNQAKNDALAYSAVKKVLDESPAYQVVEQEDQAEMVVYIFRPKKDDKGYVYPKDGKGKPDLRRLPKKSQTGRTESWLISPDNRPHEKNLRITEYDNENMKIWKDNLLRIAQVRNLTAMSTGSGQGNAINVQVTIWEQGSVSDREIRMINKQAYHNVADISLQEIEKKDLRKDQILTFEITNTSTESYYVYLLNITNAAGITPFYPRKGAENDSCIVSPGQKREISQGLGIDKEGREYIRMIASLQPLDIYLLEQPELQATRGMKKEPNPLMQHLTIRAGLTRGKPMSIDNSEWETAQATLNILP